MLVLWDFVMVLNFLIASIGLTANMAFFKLVVFSKAYDGYCRISTFIISSGMTVMIASNVISITMCLTYGSYFDTGPCGQTEAHFLMLYFHSYGEFSIGDGIFILVFERYASVFFPSFRSSEIYKLWFLALISIHIMALGTYMYLMVKVRTTVSILLALSLVTGVFVISFMLVMYLACAAKEKYYETLGLISLSKRYMLAESYELCKSALPATFVTTVISLFICITAWPTLFGYVLESFLFEYFSLLNMVMNLNATLFPILFLYGSKKIKTKICKIAPFKLQLPQGGIRKLDGHRLTISQSQNEYFDELNHSWS